ncbi:MAG: tRNA (guanosine(46)-N7)-methyltransferase TrmB [Oscillospiraceae bacterium]|nr:tRNA (guanosine(46)-N7)-methyltransferase TrmB [Oscillospiraceae bacterium]
MRMRKKPNLEKRMNETAELLIKSPENNKGSWRELFPGYEKLWLELGCGKGRFTAGTAAENPDAFIVAVEKVFDAMVVGMERVKAADLRNVRFVGSDVKLLGEMFASGEVDRIFINFCDPWPKSSDAKHRLTAPDFLRSYASLLPIGGEICFKTDNFPLFDWSEKVLREEGWDISFFTTDLHKDGINGIMTDYEAKFHAEGIKINRLVAVKTEKTLTLAAGPHERLRDASLADAIANILKAREEEKTRAKAEAEKSGEALK